MRTSDVTDTGRGRPARAAASVGSQVVRLLHEQADDLAARVGAPFELVGVAVRRLDARARGRRARPSLLTTDAEALVRRAASTSWSR